MSDWWPFSSSSPPPIIHHSPHLHPQAQVTSSHLHPQAQVTSSHLHPQAQVTSPHLHPQAQVTSSHLHPQAQVTSSHLHPQAQVTSSHLHPQAQLTSSHLHPQAQVTSSHLHPQTQVTSSHLHPQAQLTSSHLHPQAQVTSSHLHPQAQVTSPHLHPQAQVTSSHLHPQAQLTSSHLHPQAQVTSPHLHPQAQLTSPHLHPQAQVTSPHLHPQAQVTSSHLHPQAQVTSPHLHPQAQVTSSHLHPQAQVTSPHLHPQAQVTSPHLHPQAQVTSPHLHPQAQVSSPHLLYTHTQDPGLENPDWIRSEPPSELSYLLQNYGDYYQNQNHFSTGDDLENTHTLPYNTHTHSPSGVCAAGDSPGPVPDTWWPTQPQLQRSPLGSVTAVDQWRWSSAEFNPSPAEDVSSSQIFHDRHHEPFCSPATPGPSPHYPQTPTICSPGPQTHPRTERLDFYLHEYDGYRMTSDPGQRRPHRLLQKQSEPIQDQTSVLDTGGNSPQGRGQDVSGAARSAGLSAGLRRGADAGKMKRPENSSETRLVCTVCKRDFRSLPALNGHMRSHSGSRSAAGLNKGEVSSPPVRPSVSMVMPVSVPVQSRGASRCRRGQRRCSRPSLATGGAVPLYCSLLHQGEEDSNAGDGAVAGGDGAHYTPPPMLCPVRAGSGLYCSLATRTQRRVQTVQLHNGLMDDVVMEIGSPPPGTLSNKPRINEGRDFQAEIPPLWVRKFAESDSHNALLLWAPWDELEHPVNQQRVEALMTMTRSSVVPGGGASPESALHVLSESRGDFLLTVEKLLSTTETSNNNNTGWSAAERRLLVQSLQLHQKDFSRIQKVVQTKSLSQCVEFYYQWKKKKSLSWRTPAGLTVTLPDTNGQRSSRSHDASGTSAGATQTD